MTGGSVLWATRDEREQVLFRFGRSTNLYAASTVAFFLGCEGLDATVCMVC